MAHFFLDAPLVLVWVIFGCIAAFARTVRSVRVISNYTVVVRPVSPNNVIPFCYVTAVPLRLPCSFVCYVLAAVLAGHRPPIGFDEYPSADDVNKRVTVARA